MSPIPNRDREGAGRRHAALLALAAVLTLLLWQFLTVHYNFGGNWTALFVIAPHMPVPAFLKSEHLYIFQGSAGFDGQEYHLIAHDPWMRRGSADAIVGPVAFYRRILVPALAWCLALGHDSGIHAAYFTVILAFAFLGVYWLSQVAVRAGLAPTWGLAFILTPATITSIDRMTVDIALTALTVAFALYMETGERWKVLAVLACAALTKEQAMPIIGAYALFLFTRRQFLDGVWAAATALPALAWSTYLVRLQPAEQFLTPVGLTWIPLAGLVDALLHPFAYPMTPFKNAAGVIFDYVALAGFTMSLALVVRLAIQRRWTGQTSAIYALTIAASLLRNRLLWVDAYAFGRGLTPLMLLIALQDFRRRPWLALLPMLLVDARISLNLWSQILGILTKPGTATPFPHF